jgi:SAM-dependent methyltransferase
MTQQAFVENSQGRHADDFYRTPAPVTMALCDEFKRRGIEPKAVLDVGCGDGAIGLVLRSQFHRSKIEGVEADRIRGNTARDRLMCGGSGTFAYDAVWDGDWGQLALASEALGADDWDLIISNPPFKLALPFLRLALQRVRPGGHVAFLLISQWDQETVHDDERGRFLDSLRREDGSEGYGELKWKGRVDFRGDGRTDRVAHKWVIIGPGFDGFFARVPRSPMGGAEQLSLLK